MGFFALFYDVVDDFINRRTPFRSEHLQMARDAQARGELVMAGALGDPPDGALLVFNASDQTIVEEFARKDPYVLQGLVRRWYVRPWNVVISDNR